MQKNQEIDNTTVLTGQQVCELLQIKESQLNRLISKGIVPPSITGRKRLRRWTFGSIKHLVVKSPEVEIELQVLLGKHFLTIDDVAGWIGVSTQQVKKMFSAGEIPGPIKIDSILRWRASDLIGFAKSKKSLNEDALVKRPKALDFDIPPQLELFGGYLQRLGGVCMKPCVYFLMKNNAIQYIGSSNRLTVRLGGHGDKDFDSVFFVLVDPEKMLSVESEYIRIFQPPLNQTGTLNGRCATISQSLLCSDLPCWDQTSVASTC